MLNYGWWKIHRCNTLGFCFIDVVSVNECLFLKTPQYVFNMYQGRKYQFLRCIGGSACMCLRVAIQLVTCFCRSCQVRL